MFGFFRLRHLDLLCMVDDCTKLVVVAVSFHVRWSSTAPKANRPIRVRSTATAMTGECIPSFNPATRAKDPLRR